MWKGQTKYLTQQQIFLVFFKHMCSIQSQIQLYWMITGRSKDCSSYKNLRTNLYYPYSSFSTPNSFLWLILGLFNTVLQAHRLLKHPIILWLWRWTEKSAEGSSHDLIFSQVPSHHMPAETKKNYGNPPLFPPVRIAGSCAKNQFHEYEARVLTTQPQHSILFCCCCCCCGWW
jgi:hypothetical protein